LSNRMNDLVREFLEANPQYNAVLKNVPGYEGKIRRLDRFRKFKRKNKAKRVNSKLSFDINFDEDDDAISRPVISTETYVKKRIAKKTVKQKAEKKIPKKFIAHIVELGFDAKDASRLYENKDDWLGISSGGLIL